MIYDHTKSSDTPIMQPPSYESVTSPAGASRYPELASGGYTFQSQGKATGGPSSYQDSARDSKVAPVNPQPFFHRRGSVAPSVAYPEPTTLYPDNTGHTRDSKQPQQQLQPYYPPQSPGGGGPIVYYYTNPKNGHTITSFLPPDHPEMICLQAGEHVKKTKFGVVGILSGIFWFPLGLAITVLDRNVKCRRCGKVLQHGLLD